MSIYSKIEERSDNSCELCFSKEDLVVKDIKGQDNESTPEEWAHICSKCSSLMNDRDYDNDHWRCLQDSMWNPTPAVQVVIYRILNSRNDDWAIDLKGQMYLDDQTLEWARNATKDIVHIDSNGNTLQPGDNIQLTQDLKIKGANFNVTKGTIVRKISLVRDNAEQIEGKINNQTIVILTQYVKKV